VRTATLRATVSGKSFTGTFETTFNVTTRNGTDVGVMVLKSAFTGKR
jgi:hypothetical protein